VKGQFQALGNHGFWNSLRLGGILRLTDIVFRNLSVLFYVFLENNKTDLRQIFFRIWEKTLVHYNLH